MCCLLVGVMTDQGRRLCGYFNSFFMHFHFRMPCTEKLLPVTVLNAYYKGYMHMESVVNRAISCVLHILSSGEKGEGKRQCCASYGRM